MITLIVCTNKTGYVISHFPMSERNKAIHTFNMIGTTDEVECAALYDNDGEFINCYTKER